MPNYEGKINLPAYFSILSIRFSHPAGNSRFMWRKIRSYDSSGEREHVQLETPINCSGVVSSDQPQPYSLP